MIHEDSKSKIEPPQFSHYEPNVLKMMKNIGYDLISCPDLNFDKRRWTLLRPLVPRGKTPEYYHRTRRGLGYVSTPIPSASESDESLYHDHSSCTSSWESDVSVDDIFKNLSIEHGLNKPLERRRWGDDPVRYRFLDQTLEYSLGHSLWTVWITHRGQDNPD